MVKYNKFQDNIDQINEISTIARNRNIVHLYTENGSLGGRYFTINGKKLINFGSCSYLGLETDPRLKAAAIRAVKQYGTQFSSSRTYVSFTLYKELEELLNEIFDYPVILSSSTSLGHQAVIPIIIADSDAIIMDHQAHVSMQDTIPKLQVRGITVSLLRHGRLDELEGKLADLSLRHKRVWYFIDGVYSMYGDVSPIKELNTLFDKYPSFHLYIDDAHGMGWSGRNGAGYVMGQVPLHPRMILSTSLAKGFASAGGVFVIPDTELYWRVKNWGGPLTYSGPQQPAVIGASIASARIHLSDEIYIKQASLSNLIKYCNQIMHQYGLPVVSTSHSPIFFIGLGLPKVGYSMVKRLMDDGLYVNLGIFPAVPENCTGIRFTLTLHHKVEDIALLVERIAYHLPRVLEEEGRTLRDVSRAFRNTVDLRRPLEKYTMPNDGNSKPESNRSGLKLTFKTTINEISQPLWDRLLGDGKAFDWNNLALLEKSFQDNERPEDNWTFNYYIITDSNQNPVLATFFVKALTKDDMLSKPNVSKQLEKVRSKDFYYLTSQILMMGTPLTEGQHLYLDRSHPGWKESLMLLLDTIWAKEDNEHTDLLLLRDFDEADHEFQELILDLGFMKMHTPASHLMENLEVSSMEEYLKRLSSKRRYHIRKDVLEKEEWYEVQEVWDTSCIDHLYKLYENVVNNSFEINTFKFPKKLMENIIKSKEWDVIALKLKPEYDPRPERLPVAVEFSYKKDGAYYPILVGLDYDFLESAKVYKQLLYRIVERAILLNCSKIHFGLTASLEKRKLGAIAKPQVAYVQLKDTFNASLLNLVVNNGGDK